MFGAKGKRKDLRGTWGDVLKVFLSIFFLYMTLRWISWEPYVIPSGSMKPTLLVQDYVLVKKWAYGLRVPFSNSWLIGPRTPERGDIVVFRSVDDDNHFMVKRVIGLPGDQVFVSSQGEVRINGEPFSREQSSGEEKDHSYFSENNGLRNYTTQLEEGLLRSDFESTVPEGHIFLMGDNRDHSMDSRYWGALPLEKVLGEVSLIWMSCGESQKFSTFLCAPEAFRWNRIMKVAR